MLNKVRKFFDVSKISPLLLFTLSFYTAIFSEGQSVSGSQQTLSKNDFPVFRQCLTVPLELNDQNLFASDNDRLFLFSQGKVYSFQKNNLKLNWIGYLGGEAVSDFLIDGQKLSVVTKTSQPKADDQNDRETKTKSVELLTTKNILWTIDTGSGLTVNRSELPESEKYYLQNIQNELLLENSDGLIISFDERGTVKNRHATGSKITLPPIVNGQNLYIVDQKRLFSISLVKRENIDEKTIENIYTFPEIVNVLLINESGKIWAGGERGTIYALDGVKHKTLWKYRAGAKISELKLNGEKLLAVSADEFLYLFAAAKGSLRWKKRLENQIAGQIHISYERIILQITGQYAVKSFDLQTGGLINGDDFRNIEAKDSAESNILYHVDETGLTGDLILIESGGLFYFSAGTCPVKG